VDAEVELSLNASMPGHGDDVVGSLGWVEIFELDSASSLLEKEGGNIVIHVQELSVLGLLQDPEGGRTPITVGPTDVRLRRK